MQTMIQGVQTAVLTPRMEGQLIHSTASGIVLMPYRVNVIMELWYNRIFTFKSYISILISHIKEKKYMGFKHRKYI